MQYAIEAEQLVREFKKGPRAVDGIDLGVEPGEIYGFLGPNGAGKSTTVLMLVTLLQPTSGSAHVAGFDVRTEGPKVRGAIGAALQEAALDPLLTGREHLRLQATLQALPRADRVPRANELLERVGLTEAADRKVRGYSGGMKRRLDLALALIHRPRVLFLDEPTTGLDVQSRTALWLEVGRLAREDGVTVFLTTQYLEEADALADRVGIIDHGHIVAEGTPDALKAEVGRPTVEAVPADPADRERIVAVLARLGEPVPSTRGVAVRLTSGESGLADLVRALDAEHLRVEHLQLHQPSLDDVFLAKTGRTLEGAGEDEEDGLVMEPRVTANRIFFDQVVHLAGRSVVRTSRQPAQVIAPLAFPMLLLAVNSGGLRSETHLPGFPTSSFLAFALAVPFVQGALFATMNAGTDLARDIQTGFLSRLSVTPMRGIAVLAGQLGGVVTLGFIQGCVYVTVGLICGVHIATGPLGVVVLLLYMVLISLAFGSLGAFAALKTGSGEAVQGLFPAFFIFLFLSSMNIPRNLIQTTWFRWVATANPVSYLLEFVRSIVITGWDPEALALGLGVALAIIVVGLILASRALRTRLDRS